MELMASTASTTVTAGADDAAMLQHTAPQWCRTHARLYASEPAMDLLADLVTHPRFAVFIDVDALERSRLARVDGVMLLALEGLGQVSVEVVLVARDERKRTQRLQRQLPRSSYLAHVEPRRTLAELRARFPGMPLFGITDDRALLDGLDGADRGLLLGSGDPSGRANVAASSDLSVRAILWWIVDVRSRAGIATRDLAWSGEAHGGARDR